MLCMLHDAVPRDKINKPDPEAIGKRFYQFAFVIHCLSSSHPAT